MHTEDRELNDRDDEIIRDSYMERLFEKNMAMGEN
jgi:hypothetical protein